MPLYRYRCPSCEHEFEELVSSSEAATATAIACPACGESETERQLSTFAVHSGTTREQAPPFCGRCGENRPPCAGG
jgi:putative FmdB family regulatory protein